MKISSADRISVPDYIRVRRFDDELVILDLSGGDYYSLRDVGAEMWRQLVAGYTPAQVAASLAERYAADPETLLSDCLRLVDELIERKLVGRLPA